MTRRKRVLLAAGGVIGVFLAYEAVTSYVAYTDDAYVRSDLIAVAPEITGRIIGVHVTDNQTVKAGDKLVTIDPEPFALLVGRHQAEIDEAKAQVGADHDAIAVAQDAVTAAIAAVDLAQRTRTRIAELTAHGNATQQSLDQANEQLRTAEADRQAAQAAVAKAQSELAMHEAAQARAAAELGTAQWQLSRTRIVAPADGTITNLTVRVGDTGTVNVPLIGIVDAHAWRIIANYKQDYIRYFTLGHTAWVWLDSHPWRFYRGRIDSVARGISREAGAIKLLPYVAPTTDWIRLQRRFPVTITLVDPPADLTLLMGADARTVIFP